MSTLRFEDAYGLTRLSSYYISNNDNVKITIHFQDAYGLTQVTIVMIVSCSTTS